MAFRLCRPHVFVYRSESVRFQVVIGRRSRVLQVCSMRGGRTGLIVAGSVLRGLSG